MSKKCNYYENDYNQIVPNLWLGNCKSACNNNFIKKNNIKHIICIMPKQMQHFNHIKYINIPIKDNNTCDINLQYFFDNITDYIKNCIINNEAVLVHCKRGHHRSATVIAAFLIKYLKIDYITAIYYINYLRPCALRRETCMGNELYKFYLRNNNYVF